MILFLKKLVLWFVGLVALTVLIDFLEGILAFGSDLEALLGLSATVGLTMAIWPSLYPGQTRKKAATLLAATGFYDDRALEQMGREELFLRASLHKRDASTDLSNLSFDELLDLMRTKKEAARKERQDFADDFMKGFNNASAAGATKSGSKSSRVPVPDKSGDTIGTEDRIRRLRSDIDVWTRKSKEMGNDPSNHYGEMIERAEKELRSAEAHLKLAKEGDEARKKRRSE